MTDRRISLRYVKALFELDRKNAVLEKRLLDFEIITKVFSDNPKLMRFLNSPQIDLKRKKKLLFDSLKNTFEPSFLNFLFHLLDKQRLMLLGLIADEYKFMVNEHLGIWEGDIVTAVPIDDKNEAKFKETLKEKFHKKILLSKKVDPKIIGGVILIVGNEMLDWSVTGRLKKLKETIMATK
jgi:F-type H+-transporting ATPase subunit delta